MTPKLPTQEELDAIADLMGWKFSNLDSHARLKVIELAIQMRILAELRRFQ